MPSYCLKCGENTRTIILQISKPINDGIIILSKCAVCGLYVVIKKQKFIKKPEANGLLSNLVIKKIISRIPISRDILF